jgi:hypothetical protein
MPKEEESRNKKKKKTKDLLQELDLLELSGKDLRQVRAGSEDEEKVKRISAPYECDFDEFEKIRFKKD